MPNWKDVLDQIQQLRTQAAQAAQQATQTGQQAVDIVRRIYLAQLHQHTGRNVIAYYSGFLSKPEIAGVELTDEDKNGFMMAVHKLEDRSKGLDLILHTPGGDIAATESLVDYLRKMFGKNIRAIVPQIAMSAGAMVACSCREIIMTRHSNLGPIDPHLHGRPAYGVIAEFKRALREIKKDPTSVAVWQPITVHHCYMHTLMNTPAFKIVENHLGHALMKAQQQQIIQIPNVVPGNVIPTN